MIYTVVFLKLCVGIKLQVCRRKILHLLSPNKFEFIFVNKVKQFNSNINTTHCFIYREALVAKTVVPQLKSVPDQAIKLVNYIKSKVRKIRIFEKLFEALESDHISLIHSEVRWLSKKEMFLFLRMYELRMKCLFFFLLKNQNFVIF